jgi:hypothetical protein
MTARAKVNDAAGLLPAPFAAWFAAHGWTPRPWVITARFAGRVGSM